MITLTELNKKAKRPWTSGVFLRHFLQNEGTQDKGFLPFEISFKTPSGRTLGSEFIRVRDWIAELHNHSKAVTGSGYLLEYRTINHKQLGLQQLPQKIVFENYDDWLVYIGQQSAFKQFQALADQTRQQLPQIMPFFASKPLRVLGHADVWLELIKVCQYFQLNPKPNRYTRQLDIQGVDTKFIEAHKGILSELLILVLGSEDFDDSITGIAENGFERRFGLRYDEPLIRYRLLDSDAAVTDMSVPLSQLVDPGVRQVFITENKVNGLAFPPVKDAMVIFGLGYGIRSLFSVNWLKEKDIIYWGDIDTHGFSMLSQLRGKFRQTRSLLMDQATLEAHRPLCVKEPDGKRFLDDLADLTDSEQALFDALRQNKLGENLRLEQERITFSCLQDALGQ